MSHTENIDRERRENREQRREREGVLYLSDYMCAPEYISVTVKEFRKQQNQEGGSEREAAVECINYDDVMHIRGSSCL